MENNEIKKIVFNNTGLNIDDYSKNEVITLDKKELISIIEDSILLFIKWNLFIIDMPNKCDTILLKDKFNKISLFTPKTNDDLKWCSEKYIFWRKVID